MKKIVVIGCILCFLLVSCKSSDNTTTIYRAKKESAVNDQISLLNMIRKVPGVRLRNNVPVLGGTANTIATFTNEPLYILNDYIVGQSFELVDNLIDVAVVKKISVMDQAYAAIYGSRAANGVIVIETF